MHNCRVPELTKCRIESEADGLIFFIKIFSFVIVYILQSHTRSIINTSGCQPKDNSEYIYIFKDTLIRHIVMS
jgi:hypothetical protein